MGSPLENTIQRICQRFCTFQGRLQRALRAADGARLECVGSQVSEFVSAARYVPPLPALAQELRLHLAGRTGGYLFESNRHNHYSPRAIQKLVRAAAREAGIEKRVYPHLLRHRVAQLLLDRGMFQKFLGHKDLKTTQIYAESSMASVGESYRRSGQSPPMLPEFGRPGCFPPCAEGRYASWLPSKAFFFEFPTDEITHLFR